MSEWNKRMGTIINCLFIVRMVEGNEETASQSIERQENDRRLELVLIKK